VFPREIALNPATGTLYVTDFAGNTVSVISGTSLVMVPVGTQPLGVALNPSSGTIYAGNFGDGTVSVITTTN
jgi:DNA-binding beta-propeller fold protein YncE